MLSALCRLYTRIYFIHDKGLSVIDLVFWLYVPLQRYLLLPFSSISPATSVFSVFPLPASCAPIATCSSPLLRVRVVRASMLLTLTLATQLYIYQSSACSHDYTRALFLLFFTSWTPSDTVLPGFSRSDLVHAEHSKLCKKGDGVIYSPYLFSSRPCHWEYQWAAN